MDRNTDIAKVIARMTKFAATTKDDHLSVRVSRVAHRLATMPGVNPNAHTQPAFVPLTSTEESIIRPFLRERKELEVA